ncbi:MAG TPA: chorismate mutase [Draconibacterium sp.]|nr:chorismate mutase [Draconibacterium sp.]
MNNLKKPDECSSLEEVRGQIDRIDELIIQLLALRHECVEKVVHVKTDEEGVIAAARKDFVTFMKEMHDYELLE